MFFLKRGGPASLNPQRLNSIAKRGLRGRREGLQKRISRSQGFEVAPHPAQPRLLSSKVSFLRSHCGFPEMFLPPGVTGATCRTKLPRL